MTEAWANHAAARCNASGIAQSISKPYFNAAANRWWTSPLVIGGYDPLARRRVAPAVAHSQ